VSEVGGRFPTTQHSAVQAAKSDDVEIRRVAFGQLIAAYWQPVYVYLRLRWRSQPADAEDLTQEFFARALEKRYFDRYQPERTKFRTFLRVCLDGFMGNEHAARGRIKRGGQVRLVALDFAGAEGGLRPGDVASPEDPETTFRREWIRSLFALAVEDLKAWCGEAGKGLPFRVFQRYDLEGDDAGARLTYAAVAAELGIPATQVTNHLHAMRRQFRELLLARLRAVTGSEEEFRAEARELFGTRV